LRIVHLSDVHIWRLAFNPLRLMNKRALGMVELVARRARRFRLERLRDVVERAVGLEPDHVLITGDLTTTALPEEFRTARAALADLLVDSSRVTVVPGNHDRYTSGSVKYRQFEEWFGAFAPPGPYPWLRYLDDYTAVLGLDATRSHISATGRLPEAQLAAARELLRDPASRPRRLIVASHYPVAAPPAYQHELASKRMKNDAEVRDWLAGVGPHLFCCGHVHAAWAFTPRGLPDQLCLNAGAPLLRDPTGLRPPGFLEITLHDRDVSVVHHAWSGDAWEVRPLYQKPDFFAPPVEAPQGSSARGGNTG
jgi:3',5'-cyclic AMP phosphodiesterase CpdA